MTIDWGPMGVVATVLVALAGWVGAYVGRRRSVRPQLVFGPIDLCVHGEHPRDEYEFALQFKLMNVGPGVALHTEVWFEDPEEVWTAEHVHRTAQVPGDMFADWAGIRALVSQQIDPSEGEAIAFQKRCQAMAICWDQRNRLRLFFPGGPAYGLKVKDKERPFESPAHQLEFGSHFPSRGARPHALGSGFGPPLGDSTAGEPDSAD